MWELRGGGYLGGTMLGIIGVEGGGGEGGGFVGIGGIVISEAGYSLRRTVVARSGTPEGDIGPDGAEGLEEEGGGPF